MKKIVIGMIVILIVLIINIIFTVRVFNEYRMTIEIVECENSNYSIY
ncbi:MAG: hypothetical protein ACK5HR_03105 [Mycoplasmatales bacterium]